MKKIFTFLLFAALVWGGAAHAQTTPIKGHLAADSAELTVLNIYPDSFPGVSVIFKAETKAGQPVWNLSKNNMKVLENNEKCAITSVAPISKNKPINLGIVIDHSGSMADDATQLFDKNGNALFTFNASGYPVFPKGYIAPIDNAKSAINDFIASFNASKDYISLVSFSNNVDQVVHLSQDVAHLHKTVNSINAMGGTALYDGMLRGIEEVNKRDGIKVLVVVTDGQDNMSHTKWKTIVKKANARDIPVYIIGLGDVDAHILKKITAQTKGEFYFTRSSKSLHHIYEQISHKVQAYYELVYQSPNFSKNDSDRELQLSFDIDSIALVSHPATMHLPASILASMKPPVKKDLPDEVKSYVDAKDTRRDYTLFGAVAVALTLGGGTLVYRYKKQTLPGTQAPRALKSIYPNPGPGVIHVVYEGSGGQLAIHDMSGNLLKTIELTGERTFDLSDFSNGLYTASIIREGAASNVMKFVIQH